MSDIPRRIFETNELPDAVAFARDGGQALHLHQFCGRRAPKCFRDAIARGESIAHLFDVNEVRLERTARLVGVNVVVIEKSGTARSHVDLCGEPLKRAVRLFSVSQRSLWPLSEGIEA